MTVTVIGGGWSGLAAATYLVSQKIPVVVLESAKQLGGRARCAAFDAHMVDYGQHIFTGSNHRTFELFKLLGITGKDELKRLSYQLRVFTPKSQKPVFLNTRHLLPAPLHMLYALLTASRLSVSERFSAMQFFGRMFINNFKLGSDISVEALLIRYRQTGLLRKAIWEPICLFHLNTPVKKASARMFLSVLKSLFGRERRDSDILIPTTSLCKIMPEPAMQYIEQHGGNIYLQKQVKSLLVDGNEIGGLILENDAMASSNVIIATSPLHCYRLLNEHRAFAPVAQSLGQLNYQPITTVYFQFDETFHLEHRIIGLTNSIAQWVYDRSLIGQNGVLSVLLNAEGPHLSLSDDELIAQILSELKSIFKSLPEPLNARVIREKRATFSCEVNVANLRPGNETPVKGCWIAGDYTNTGLPASLESAIQSGINAAKLAAKQYQHQR